MFVNECSACERRQLIFPSQITSVADVDGGTAVSYTCWCGSAQTWLTSHGTPVRPLVAA